MFGFLNEWWMGLSEFGALTKEFNIAEIGTWKNYGGKSVWRFIGRQNNKFFRT